MTPAKLYEAANRASADAIRYRRCPHGGHLAAIRERDASALRALARQQLQQQGTIPGAGRP